MKAIIIEDETTAIKSLKAILHQNTITEIEIVAELESIEESIFYLRKNPLPDIIFMDIHLADGLAFKIFEQVEIKAPVIFTTAYDEYALQAFKVSSIDYLLKPITLSALERAVEKFYLFNPKEQEEHIRKMNQTLKQTIPTLKNILITLVDKFYILQVEDVLFFYSTNDKVTAYTIDGKQHPIEQPLDQLSKQLEPYMFFRANRQFIISKKAIKDIDLWFGNRLSVNLSIKTPERIIISKTKTPLFKKWIVES